jgi:hypothetical protein
MPDTSTVIRSTQFLILEMNGTPINETAPLRGRTLAEFEEYATSVIATAVRLGAVGGGRGARGGATVDDKSIR